MKSYWIESVLFRWTCQEQFWNICLFCTKWDCNSILTYRAHFLEVAKCVEWFPYCFSITQLEFTQPGLWNEFKKTAGICDSSKCNSPISQWSIRLLKLLLCVPIPAPFHLLKILFPLAFLPQTNCTKIANASFNLKILVWGIEYEEWNVCSHTLYHKMIWVLSSTWQMEV